MANRLRDFYPDAWASYLLAQQRAELLQHYRIESDATSILPKVVSNSPPSIPSLLPDPAIAQELVADILKRSNSGTYGAAEA